MKKITEYTTRIGGKYKALTLVSEKEYEYNAQISSPRELYDLIENTLYLGERSEEYMYMLCLNTKNEVKAIFQISMGALDRALVSPQNIFKRALLCNAKSIVLTHNHPSGDAEPSQDDINLTKKIKSGCDLLDINLLDHIVVGYNKFASMKQRQLF